MIPSFDPITASDGQCVILSAMSDELGYPFSYFAERTGITEGGCRRIIRQFRDFGLAEYGPLYNEDEPAVCGSGYWLNGNGCRAQVAVFRMLVDPLWFDTHFDEPQP